LAVKSEHINEIAPPIDFGGNQLDPVLEQVLQHVRLRAWRRIAWLRKLWSESNTAANGHTFHTEVDGYLGNIDTPPAEFNWYSREESLQSLNKSIAETQLALISDNQSRWTLFHQIFGLSRAESDLLQACVALAIEPNFGRIYAYLQDHSGRGYVTEELAARLFGHGWCLPLPAESPLKTWRLIIETRNGPGEPPRFECDPFVRNWLLGWDDLDPFLVGFTQIKPTCEPLKGWPLADVVNTIEKVFQQDVQKRIRLFIAGEKGSGRRSFAAVIARHFNLPLLVIDTDRIPVQNWELLYVSAQRQAFLHRSALAWTGTNIMERSWPQTVLPFQVQFVIGEVDEYLSEMEGVIDYRFELPVLSIDERLSLWQTFVPKSDTWPENELNLLAQRHQSTIGQILQVAAKGVHNPVEASEALRATSRQRLGSLAQQLDCPFRWSDLVLPASLRHNLEDFVFEATEGTVMWERPEARRLFPQGKGLIALFNGSPGTGKTMAAQVIAAELQRDLFRIDLSAVVSKYVGETSKNIERILSRAQRMDALLLFDEADALFGKRTEIRDAHDRFANSDTNYLLQAIEQYPGIAILACNKKANLDGGFMRRLRYILEFPKPEAPQRLELWRRIIGELVGPEYLDAIESDLRRLAEAVEVTGAQIKYSVLSGIFIARRERSGFALPYLLRGLERELMKEGRGLGRQLQDVFNIKAIL
jgi:hypothetical protein